MKALKFLLLTLSIGVLTLVGYGSSIGSSAAMQLSGIETAGMGLENRNTTTTTRTTTTSGGRYRHKERQKKKICKREGSEPLEKWVKDAERE